MLDALAEAHAISLVHRDLKPPNLFLTGGDLARPNVKVLDFGLVRDLGQRSTGRGLAGSPRYIAPELLGSDAYDERADIWSLGIVVHECLHGEPAFARRTVGATFEAILHDDPPRLPSGTDAAVVRIVARALAKVPAKRFASAVQMAEAIVDAMPRGFETLIPERWRESSAILEPATSEPHQDGPSTKRSE